MTKNDLSFLAALCATLMLGACSSESSPQPPPTWTPGNATGGDGDAMGGGDGDATGGGDGDATGGGDGDATGGGDGDAPGGGDGDATGGGDGDATDGGDGDVAGEEDAGLDASTGGGDGDAGVDAGPTEDPADAEFRACTAALKPKCKYDEMETACSSLITPVIPLTNGSTWGGIELQQGPYGAYVEWNEGKAFENPINALENICSIAAGVFREPESVTQDILNLRGQDLGLYTVFRPACWKEGEKYPVITWGNGTCGQTGGYGTLLATVASHGFVVVAANSRWTGDGTVMLRALDLAKALNEDPSSIYYQRLDLDKVGAMGHSQGAGATNGAAQDPRVKAAILWNGPRTTVKPFLAVSGERDIGSVTPQAMAQDVNGASPPAAWVYFHQVLETGGTSTGHLTLMEQPERVTDLTIAWWKYILLGDPEAKKMFVGDDCGLCNRKAEFEYGQNGKLP